MKYTMSDIAKLAGVSKSTVSRVINNNPKGVGEATKEKVLKIIEEANYRPNILARSIAVSHSNTIGLIIPDISNLFFPTLVRAVDKYISEKGYSMILCNTDNDPKKEKEHLLSLVDKRVDGIIVASGVSNEKFLKEFKKYNTPIVLIGRIFDSKYSDASITGDNKAGAIEAVEYLISHGNKKIVYLDGDRRVWGSLIRFEGYKKALERHDIQLDEKLIAEGEFSIEFGFEQTSRIIKEGIEFDAVFTGSDLVAIGAMKALKKNNIKIPDEVEVIGFDGIELSKIYEPELTTVAKPHFEMAQEASKMLLSIINGEESMMRHIQVFATLIIRNTTRKD